MVDFVVVARIAERFHKIRETDALGTEKPSLISKLNLRGGRAQGYEGSPCQVLINSNKISAVATHYALHRPVKLTSWLAKHSDKYGDVFQRFFSFPHQNPITHLSEPRHLVLLTFR